MIRNRYVLYAGKYSRHFVISTAH